MQTRSFFTPRPRPWARLLLLGGLLASGCQTNTSSQTEQQATATAPAAGSKAPLTSATRPPGGFFVRHNASSPEGQADLAALQKAMARMKTMPCDSP